MAQSILLPALPSEAEAILAKETSRLLGRRAMSETMRLQLLDAAGSETLDLPAAAWKKWHAATP